MMIHPGFYVTSQKAALRSKADATHELTLGRWTPEIKGVTTVSFMSLQSAKNQNTDNKTVPFESIYL